MTTQTSSEPTQEEKDAVIRDHLADREWRLCNLYKIVTKEEGDDGEGLVVDFVPNKAQRRLMSKLHHRNLILKARQLGFCVDPSTRVLTAGLEWIPIGDIEPGTEVVAVDENVPGGRGSARKMRTAVVQAKRVMQAERWRIKFDDGREVICTGNHPWLSRKVATDAKWRSMSGEGNAVVGKLKVGTKVRWVTKPWDAPTVEDGWFGGMLDGEGCMSKDNVAASVNVSQRHGPVWERLVKYAEGRGYNACIENDAAERQSKHGRVPVPKLAFGRMDELFRLMGQTRPTRFIDRRWWEGRELPGKRNGGVGWATIVEIEPLGVGEVVDMQTSTGTYIAEGFVSHNTTLVAILWLDTALFSPDPMYLGIIAHEREAAESIFRDKVLFAYEHLPEFVRAMCPIERKNATQIVFGHNKASIRVATSVRSGTIHRLHVSEFGKIARKYPHKAKEVVTGSIPAVPGGGMLIIESTAEGQDGFFYDYTMRAKAALDARKLLTPKDYRLHFFAWWEAAEYRLEGAAVAYTDAHREYFSKVEAKIGRVLDEAQRAWYVTTMEQDFAGEQPLMWQEYPSYPEEAFQISTEGCYYINQITKARQQGRIGIVPVLPGVPVHTFWDLGRGDMTAVWLMQKLDQQHRFIRYYENSGEDLSHYVEWLQRQGVVFARHWLPHDAAHRRMGQNADTSKTLKQMLEGLLPGQMVDVVPVVSNILAGIQATRNALASAWFDEAGCAQGIVRASTYRKDWDKRLGRWKDEPLHDDASHGADALRQWGQKLEAGETFGSGVYAALTNAVAGGARPSWKAARRKLGGGGRPGMAS